MRQHTSLTEKHTHTQNLYTKNMVLLDLWKGLLRKESFELSFFKSRRVGEGGQISQTGRERIPGRWSNETDRALSNRFQTAFRDIQNTSRSRIGR